MITINGTNVETGINTEPVRVSGGIRMAAGAAPVVNASWGSITGDILSQTDLMDLLSELGSAIASKASANDLSRLSGTVATKLTTPTGEEGQFMVYESGAWKGKTLAAWEGGNY